MNNYKQSSIDWLQAIELERDLTLADWNKAKAMHKEEIEDAHYQGQSDEKEYWNIGDKCMTRFQGKCMEYYNETFGE